MVDLSNFKCVATSIIVNTYSVNLLQLMENDVLCFSLYIDAQILIY